MKIIILLLIGILIMSCKKGYINPDKQLKIGDFVRVNDVLPYEWQPFKIVGMQQGALEVNTWRYYLVSNNGVYITVDTNAGGIDYNFTNNDKKFERKVYTWTKGRCYNLYSPNVQTPYVTTFIHCDSLGHNYGLPFIPSDLPKPE